MNTIAYFGLPISLFKVSISSSLSLWQNRDKWKAGGVNTMPEYTDIPEFEEVEPDEWDLKMMAECVDDDPADVITFDESLAIYGLTRNDLHN